MPTKAEEPYWEDSRFKAYAESNYTYDDAELLASLWNIDIIEAKKTIGYKIMNKLEDLLPEKIQGGSGGDGDDVKITPEDQLDAFFNSNYTYDDAELLASLWNIDDVVEAKKTIGNKILNGWEQYLPEKIQGGTGKFADDGYDLEALGMFVLSPYTFNDADQLAQLWDISIVDAKEIIGIKILNGDEALLPDEIRRDQEQGC